jgi:hypothetical protein
MKLKHLAAVIAIASIAMQLFKRSATRPALGHGATPPSRDLDRMGDGSWSTGTQGQGWEGAGTGRDFSPRQPAPYEKAVPGQPDFWRGA